MNKIQINKHPLGRINNIHFGLCCIADGFVRVLSLGFLHSTFTLDQTRNATRKQINQLKKNQEKIIANMIKHNYDDTLSRVNHVNKVSKRYVQ